MPLDALPEHINEPQEWKNTDDDQVWWMRWRLYCKGLFAYGPRSKKWWACWREWPITLFKIGGEGEWRYEDDKQDGVVEFVPSYLSRVQYYKRWHLAIQWPFLITWHRYNGMECVPEYPNRGKWTDGKLWFFYFGAHRDSDKVYWFPSAYLGRNWK